MVSLPLRWQLHSLRHLPLVFVRCGDEATHLNQAATGRIRLISETLEDLRGSHHRVGAVMKRGSRLKTDVSVPQPSVSAPRSEVRTCSTPPLSDEAPLHSIYDRGISVRNMRLCPCKQGRQRSRIQRSYLRYFECRYCRRSM